MITLNFKRLVLAIAVLAFLANALVFSGQEKSSGEKRDGVEKTDAYGDPLPDGARARMGTLRWRHPAAITFVSFISNNKQVLTGCGDGYFRIWDTVSGKEVRKFGKARELKVGKIGKGGGGRGIFASGGTLSADAKVLAEMTTDGQVRLWDVAGGKEMRSLAVYPKMEVNGGLPAGISSMAFSPNGKVLATLELNGVVGLWDTDTGKEIRRIGKPPDQGKGGAFPFFLLLGANPPAFLGDGKTIVSVGMELDNQMQGIVLRIHNVDSGKELRRIKAGDQNFFRASGLAVLPKSKTIAWSGMDGTIRLYDADSGKEIGKVGLEKQNAAIRTLLFSPDGKIMATQAGNSPAIHLRDVASGKELRKLGERLQANMVGGGFVGIAARGSAVAFSGDGKTLAEATSGNSVRLWNVDSGEEIVPVGSGHHGSVSRLAVSADGKILTTCAGDQTIRQWDVATGKELRQTKVPAVSIGFSGDGKLAAWSSAAKITVWDVAGAKEIRTIDLPGQKPKGPGLAFLNAPPTFSANKKWLALRSPDQVLHVFDIASGKEGRALVERNEPDAGGGIFRARALARSAMGFSADGVVFAAISTNIGLLAGGGGPGSMANAGSSLRMWNLTQGRNPRLFDTDKKSILDLVVTPDGHNIVTANGDQTISVWEGITGKECLQIKLPGAEEKPPLNPLPPPAFGGPGILAQASAVNLAVSPDGRTLAAGIGRLIHLFDLRTGKELGQFKGHQGIVVSVAFGPDSHTVISGSLDTSALVWEGSRFIKKSPTLAWKPQQVDDLWQDLAGDPVKAYLAIGKLSAAPRQAVALVKEKVKAAALGDDKRIAQLINDLESDQFQVRQTATKELEKFGELVEPALQKGLQTLKTLEAKRRVDKLLAQIADDQTPSAAVVRTLRAVQILGNLGTPEARAELEHLAKGAPGDKLTRSAETALRRLKK